MAYKWPYTCGQSLECCPRKKCDLRNTIAAHVWRKTLMLHSMTGFARESAETTLGTLTWEIRAVNHRYLDVQFKLPEDLRPKEQAFRQQASSHSRPRQGRVRAVFSASIRSAIRNADRYRSRRAPRRTHFGLPQSCPQPPPSTRSKSCAGLAL